MKRTLFTTRMLASIVMSFVALMASADEYIDPKTNVVYTYQPGQTNASVKAGYYEVIDRGDGYELEVEYYPGCPDAAGDVVILDRFTVGTEEYVVTNIGEAAFRANRHIKSVSIPETVTDIAGSAFSLCDSLKTVQLPEGLTRVAPRLFAGCSQLVSVDIPSSVSIIDSYAFNSCVSLASLALPAGLTRVGRGAFEGTPWYASLYDEAPEGPFYIGSLLLSYKGNMPTGELVIKEGTTYIGYGVFINCGGLTSVSIPESVTYVDQLAFENCSGLTAVHIKDLAAWCGIEFQWGYTQKSSNPLCYAHHLYLNGEVVTDLVIPEGVTSIGSYAFDGCTDLTSVTIPNGVTNIGTYAFRECSNLTSVTIPPSMATMGEMAFIWCFNLNAVHISDLAGWCGISFLGSANSLFFYGASLYLDDKEVKDLLIIPEGVTTIGNGVFKNYSRLTTVVIPNSVTEIGEYAFSDCSDMTSVTIGNNVNSIGQWAFSGCQKLMDVYCYAQNTPYTENDVFYNTKIENITLHVPAASISAYQTVEPWKNFKQIVALTDMEEYHPLLEEGKVWQYSYNNGVRQYMKSLTISGDTIIGDQTYKKIIDVASQGIEMFLREEGKKVYCCYPYNNTEILLYDFGKNAGEIISREVKNGDTWIRKVIAVDSIVVKDNPFRCMTVHEYVIPDYMSEEEYFAGNYGYDSNFWVEGIGSLKYLDTPIGYDGNYYSFYECQIGDVTYKQKDFLDAIKNNTQPAYRPFVEEGKVWKVGDITSGNPVQLVDYYYFDGDTIIDGKVCKQMMMCQWYVSPDYPEYDNYSQRPSLNYVGAWYEEDKKVYFCGPESKRFTIMYDFSLDAYDTFMISEDDPYYVVGPKQTGGLKGFKGVYRDVWRCDGEINSYSPTWLEGVGSIKGPLKNVHYVDEVPTWILMSCTVGDEVIYLNDEYEDKATPAGARKRFDFSHTIKTKPKARNRSGAESLYGEYNDQQLGINLNPLDDAYLVSITDETGKVVYEKSINAGNIVGLNIDISAYAKGHYTVTVENSNETFTGEFDAQTTGIRDVRWKKEDGRSIIYNLQGQRLHSLQKGLNIVNGQKVFVK